MEAYHILLILFAVAGIAMLADVIAHFFDVSAAWAWQSYHHLLGVQVTHVPGCPVDPESEFMPEGVAATLVIDIGVGIALVRFMAKWMRIPAPQA